MSYARFGSPLVAMSTDEWLAWNERQRAAIDALDDSVGWGEKVPEELSGSDVYVYADVGGYLCCCGCILGDRYDFGTTDEMIAHLKEHEAAGHRVPVTCYEGLEADRKENDEWLATQEDKEQ